MLRRSLPRRIITNPDLHRHSESTFKDGHHRSAPKPGLRAWVDPKSPLYRGVDWMNMPVNRTSLIFAWSCVGIVSYYCFCVSYDLRGVYNQNHKLQRQMHISHARAEDSERRLADLQAVVSSSPIPDSEGGAALSHEMELTRERARVRSLSDRNQILVTELAEIRGKLSTVTKENVALAAELERVRVLLKRLNSA